MNPGGAPCSVCGGRGWHTAGGNDPMDCGNCAAGVADSESVQGWIPGLEPETADAAPAPTTGRLRLVALTQRAAFKWIATVHRHLDAPRGDIIRVGVEREGVLVGVAVGGRPVAEALQDGGTLEINRVAVLDGQGNACSMLYGAIKRAAFALGYRRVITYTRMDEGGASLRASGATDEGEAGGGEWNCAARPRSPARQPIRKRRWSWTAP